MSPTTRLELAFEILPLHTPKQTFLATVPRTPVNYVGGMIESGGRAVSISGVTLTAASGTGE